MQRLDRDIFNSLYNSKDGRKALALLIVLKRVFPASSIPNYSHNKLRKILRMHIDTLKRLMGILIANGLCEFVGRKKKTLRLRSIRTKFKAKDMDISFIRFGLSKREDGSYEGVRYVLDKIAKEIVAVYILDVYRRRSFAEQLVSLSVDPRSKDEMIKADKERRRRGYRKAFEHKGVSYKGLAERLGMSEQMAYYVVKYAVNSGLLIKQNNVERIDTTDTAHLKDMAKIIRDKFDKNKDYTFICGRFVYFVGANDYLRGWRAVHNRANVYQTSIDYKN